MKYILFISLFSHVNPPPSRMPQGLSDYFTSYPSKEDFWKHHGITGEKVDKGDSCTLVYRNRAGWADLGNCKSGKVYFDVRSTRIITK